MQKMTFLQLLAVGPCQENGGTLGQRAAQSWLGITCTFDLGFQFAQVPEEVSAGLGTLKTLFYSPAFTWLCLTLCGYMAMTSESSNCLGYSSDHTTKTQRKP